MKTIVLTASVAALALSTSAAGCAGRATPSVTTVTNAPLEIESSPYVTYEGRPTYYYQNRWYYRDGGNWRSYKEEPVELHRHRPYVQQVAPDTAPGPAPP